MRLPNAFNNPEEFWSTRGFVYKFMLITSLTIFFLGLVFPSLLLVLFDAFQLTILKLQLWRILFSFYFVFGSILNILSIIFSFLWMPKFFQESEKSSVYIFWELIIINVEIHIIFNILSSIIYFLGINPLLGYGWFPIIIVYEFRQSKLDPEGTTTFCCLPCLIKKKYFPYILVVLLGLFTYQPFCMISALILGYIQQIKLGSNLIKLPFCFYQKFEKILPQCIVTRPDFHRIQSVENVVKLYSCNGGHRNQSQRNQNNPYSNHNRNQPEQKKQGNVFASKGVQISGNSSNEIDYKSYWKFKAKDQSPQNIVANEHLQELEIEPEIQNKKQDPDYKYNSLNDQGKQEQLGDISDATGVSLIQKDNKKQDEDNLI